MPVWSAAFFPDNRTLLTGGADRVIRRWDSETGEPIGLRRLDARPIATLSVEAQERHERRERVYRDE